MADQEFLVDVSFDVDESGAAAAEDAVGGLQNAAETLAQVLIQAAKQIRAFFQETQTGAESVNQVSSAVNEAAQATDQLTASEEQASQSASEMASSQEQVSGAAAESSQNLGQAAQSSDKMANAMTKAGGAASGAAPPVQSYGNAAGHAAANAEKAASSIEKANAKASMANAKQGSVNLKQLNGQLKKVTRTVQKFIALAATALIGSSIKQAFSDVMKMNEGLAETAKTLKMTVEQARAHQIALATMGKTAEEIKNDKSLQAIYNDLTAIGKQLALPETAQGLTAIQDLKNGLMQLKVVGNYALQWIYYKIQTVAAGPLAQFRDTLTGMKDWLVGNMDKISTAIAKGFKWVVQIINSVITVIKKVIGWIDKLPPSIKTVGAVALAVIAAIKSKMALITLIVTAILLLIDDLVTYMEGGESALGAFWGPMLDYVNKIKPVLQDIINKFDKIITTIKEAWTQSSGFLDFIKRLALGDDYEPDASWETVGQKIWEKIKSGFKTVKGWIFQLLFPDGVPEDIGSGDWSGLANKILAKITEGIKAITGIGGAVIEGAGNMAIDLATSLIDGITTTLGNTDIKSITGAVTGLVKRLLTAITNVFSSGNLTKISSSIKGLVQGIFSAIGTVLGDIGQGGALTDIGQTIVDLISNIFDAASDLLSNFNIGSLMDGVQKLVEGLFFAISNMFSTENIGKISTSVSGFINNLLGAITGAIKDLAGRSNVVTDAGNAIVDLVSGLLNGAADVLSNLNLGDVTSSVGDLVNNLLTAIGNVFSKENIGKVADSLKGFVSNLFKAIGDAISGALNGIGSLSGFDIGTGAADIVTNLLDAIFGTIEDLSTDPNITGFIDKLGQGLVSALGTIGETLGTFAGKIVSWIFSGDAIETIFNAGKNIIGLLIKGIESGVSGIFNFAFNLIDGILEGLGIIDPETSKAYKAAMETGQAYVETINDAFNDLTSDPDFANDQEKVGQAILEAMFLKQADGMANLDPDSYTNFLQAVRPHIEQMYKDLFGFEGELGDDTIMFEVEHMFDNMWEAINNAAMDAALNPNVDFTGIDVKNIMGPVLEQLGQSADLISDEAYNKIAQAFKEGGLENSNDMYALIFESLLTGQVPEVDAENATEEAREAARELGIETKEAAQEGYQEGLNSGEAGTSTVNVGDVEVTGNGPVTASQDVKVEAGEVDASPLGESVKSGAITAIEEQSPEVATAAETMANGAAAKFAAVLSQDAGTKMGQEFSAGLGAGLAETSAIDTAVSAISGKFPTISAAMAAVDKAIKKYVSSIAASIRSIPTQITITASLLGADSVTTLAEKIIDALNKIPRTITVKATTSTEFGFGGVVSQATQATVGEDGKEYIIPVTKPDRAASLLKQAAADLGLTVSSAKEAAAMLGGSGNVMQTPAYAAAQQNTVNTVNNYNTVSAPATFNVRGTDAQAIADNVNRNHESVILRNIKSAIA